MNPMMGKMGGTAPSMGVAPMSQAPTPQMGSGGAPSTGNVMQITSTLRGMSDQQLQQYAAMHKSDPFVFPLAFQESQTRQQMRAGSLAQRAGQKPPPVVDQDLQQMTPTPITGGAGQAITGGHGQAINALPEEQGIGAIPAENLQSMADGGIAGYADGGQQPGMFNYAQMAPAVDLHPDSGVTPRGMASGGLADVKRYKDEGLVNYGYKQLTAADLPSDITQESVNQRAGLARTAAELAAAPDIEKTNALFNPYIEKLKGKEADIEERRNGNLNMALLQAGLGMMGGTSPHAFTNIAKGGQEGVAAYVSGKKAINDAQDALDQAQFLAAQSKNAAIKGDVKSQLDLQHQASSEMAQAQQLKYHGIEALDRSSKEFATLGATKEANDIKRMEAASLDRLRSADIGLKGAEKDYYQSRIVSPEDKTANQLDARVNQATARSKTELAKLMAKPYQNEKAINNIIKLHNQEIDSIYAAHPNVKDKYGYLPAWTAEAAPEEKGFWESMFSSNPAPAAAPVAPKKERQFDTNTIPGGPLSTDPQNPGKIKFLGFEK